MAGTLPDLTCCPETCEEGTLVSVPGIQGEDGAAGAAGASGNSAYTTFSAAFTMPGELASGVAALVSTSWMAVNQIVYAAKADGSVLGTFQVTAIGGATSATLKNLEDAATGAYASNSAPGTIFTIGSMLVPSGYQGTMGAAAGTTLVGDVTGTIGANLITKNAALGSMLVGNGTSAQALAKGTDGQILVSDAAAALDLQWKSLLPNTGGTNVLDNALLRLDTATGLPIPAQASPMVLTDAGALQVTYGNAKGANAVDLQASHSGVTQVASGAAAVIAGGTLNTAAGAQATVSGGDTNSSAGTASVVGGGATNNASANHSTVSGGTTNNASGIRSTVGGGLSNTAASQGATVAGGESNAASATDATVGGGTSNGATVTQATVAGGYLNVAAAIGGFIGGGALNAITGSYGHISGGNGGLADQYGQRSMAAGIFAVTGDAQASKVVMRINTTDATPAELKLDGVAAGTNRLTIATGKSWMFQIMIVVRRDNGLTSIYKSEGLITNVAGVTTCPAAPTTTEIYDGIGLPAAPIVVAADDPSNSLTIQLTGVAATNLRAVASVNLVEVAY